MIILNRVLLLVNHFDLASPRKFYSISPGTAGAAMALMNTDF